MKKRILFAFGFVLALAATIVLAKLTAQGAAKLLLKAPPAETVALETRSSPAATLPPDTEPVPSTEEMMPPTETTAPDVYHFTPEEEELLLKLGMTERGDTGCADCIALVMRTVLNRVESGRFSSTIRGVIYAKDQFTPVAEGTFDDAKPNEACFSALERVKKGWDESQGALYYEWCEGESWHSQNLKLLFQHCDTRFYQ